MTRSRRVASRPGSARGQSLVEFALVFPIALLVILAIFDMGRAVFIYNGLTNAAREGARLAIVNQTESAIADRVATMSIGAEVTNLGDADFLAFKVEDLDDGTTTATDCPTMVTGCVAVVTARAQWQAITPIIGSIVGPLTLQAQAELPIEFVCPNTSTTEYATPSDCPRQP